MSVALFETGTFNAIFICQHFWFDLKTRSCVVGGVDTESILLNKYNYIMNKKLRCL